jgi:hypothetical protein
MYGSNDQFSFLALALLVLLGRGGMLAGLFTHCRAIPALHGLLALPIPLLQFLPFLLADRFFSS